MSNPDQVECVGTLLVHSSDVQELSANTKTIEESSASNLQRRVTAGTLLVPSSDLRSPVEKQEEHHDESSPKGSLRRRITEKLTSPAPPDEDADNWAD